MILRTLAFFFICFCATIHGVDYIHDQDKRRCQVFSQTHDEQKAQPFTSNISKKLTASNQIDYGREASIDEREKIYKAIMGTVIVHGSGHNFYRKDVLSLDARYKKHYEALEIIDKYAQKLWEDAQKKQHIQTLDQICQDSNHAFLLTEYFLKWFYEALSAYRPEITAMDKVTAAVVQPASLLSTAEAVTEDVIDIEFLDGTKGTYKQGCGFSFKGRLPSFHSLKMNAEAISFDGTHIDLKASMSDIVRQFKSSSHIRSAELRSVPLSPDAKFEREIAAFNKMQNLNLPLPEKTSSIRKFYALTQHYKNEGSALAEQNMPLVQSLLGIDLANLAKTKSLLEGIPLLRESASLLEEGIKCHVEIAIKNASALYFILGAYLVSAADKQQREEAIPTLREGIQFLDKSKKMGNLKAEEQIAIAQFLLSQHLFHSVIPNQSFSNPIGTNEIASLKEAVDLCESSTKHVLVATEFLKQLKSIFAQVAPKEPKSSVPIRQNFLGNLGS